MDEERVWSAAELEQLTPDERQRLLDERVVTELSEVDPAFLERVLTHGRAILEQRGLVGRRTDGG